jgi:large-conductance mechanosensitive channel
MYKRLLKLDFGIQMLIITFALLLTNQLSTYTFSMMNKQSTLLVYLGLFLTLVVFTIQVYSVIVGVKLIINRLKKDKNKNTDNEQSN